jgi:hypothetical protein
MTNYAGFLQARRHRALPPATHTAQVSPMNVTCVNIGFLNTWFFWNLPLHYVYFLLILQIDSYLKVTWILRTGLMGPLLCTCMYALLTPGLLSTVIYNKFILESIGFLMASLFVFLAGELLASFNLTWRSALYNSPWYKCSNKTKKVIPLLLLLNQTHDYHSLNGLIPCSHEYMVRMIKMAYSVFNLLRVRRLNTWAVPRVQ